MSKEERKRRKKEMATLVETLTVVFLGERAFLGQLEMWEGYKGAEHLTLNNAYPIGMPKVMATDENGQPVPGPGGIPQMINVPQLGTIHWCILEPVAKLHLPLDTPHYRVKDQSAESQAAFAKTYHDLEEELREVRKREGANEELKGSGLITLASPGDEKRVAEVSSIFKEKGRG